MAPKPTQVNNQVPVFRDETRGFTGLDVNMALRRRPRRKTREKAELSRSLNRRNPAKTAFKKKIPN